MSMINSKPSASTLERAGTIFNELVTADQCKKVLTRLKKMETKLNANIKAKGDADAGAMSQAYDRLNTLRFLITKTEENIQTIETAAEDFVTVN